MKKGKVKSTITVKGTEIEVVQRENIDYISLTDLAKYKDELHSDDIIKNWLRNRNTIELLGIWEKLNNPNFKPVEFDGFRNQSGLNSFVMTPKKWIENTNAIGIISKSGRYGGTYAHKDIAFEFASWISVEFKLYIIKEFQRLKDEENKRLSLDWNLHRTLSKVNYRIHTDAVKENIIPPEISKAQESFIYASEADLLNVALYGKTASQWRKENTDKEGNIRDYSTIEQLLVLANLESLNAEFIRMQIPMNQRLVNLNRSAIAQMKSLLSLNQVKKLK
ncbi:MAG: KilA-N domain-containing protein [Candidatus Nanoarchaeia archaeon]|nr:KilA-N domain-containing protein [Candidatus Nanoarchaeia archaeon]